jgi:hypothetical protein
VGLLIASVIALFAVPEDFQQNLHLAAIASYLAFIATGASVLFGAALAIGAGALIWDVVSALPLDLDDLIRVTFGLVMLTAHLWVSLAAVVKGRHTPRVPRVLAFCAGLVCFTAAALLVGLGLKELSIRDVAFCAAGVWLAWRLGRESFAGAFWVPLFTAAVASWAFGERATASGLAAGAALVLTSGHRGVRAAGWVTATIAFSATMAELDRPLAPVTLAFLAAGAFDTTRRSPSGFRLTLAASAFSGAAALAVQQIVPSPAAGALAALAAAEIVPLLDHTRSAGAIATGLRWISGAAVIATLIITPDAAPIERAAAQLTLLAIAALSIRDARGHLSSGMRLAHAFVVEVALAGVWMELRARSGIFADVPNADAWACLVAAFVMTGVHSVLRRGASGVAFERTARVSALVLPILAALAVEHEASFANAAFALAASASYALLARAGTAGKIAGVLSAAAFNVAAFLANLRFGLQDPQLYVLPLSGSLLVLAQVYQRDLSDRALGAIRVVALSAAYLSGFVSIMAFDAPHHALIMAAVCTAGVVLGAALRIKSYLLLGAGFLVVDLATNVVRFGLSGQTAATLVLTGLGLSILGAMVAWSLHRPAIEAILRRVAGDVESWAL